MNTVIAILIIVTGASSMKNGDKTGLWLEEYAIPYVKFKEQGFKVTVATIDGGAVPIDPNSLKDEIPEWKEAMEALKSSIALKEIDTQNFQAVYIPGGHGAMFDLADSSVVKSTISEFAENNRTVSSICHGPASLVGVKLKNGKYLVDGKKLVSFTNNEEDEVNKSALVPFMLESKLIEQGATFQAKANWANNVVVDGSLITGQNPSGSASIADAIIKQVKEKYSN